MKASFALLACVLSGCREELGPERFVTTQVSGTIRMGGRPIGGGWIEFVPVEGTVGKLRSTPIRSDGSFSADRVAVGWNQIGLINTPIDRRIAHDFHPLSSPIRRKIPAHRSEIEIDLLFEEEFKNRKAASRQP